MGRAKKSSDQGLIALFLEMLAAERGAAANTLAAYERDLADFSEHLTAARRDLANAERAGQVHAEKAQAVLQQGERPRADARATLEKARTTREAARAQTSTRIPNARP